MAPGYSASALTMATSAMATEYSTSILAKAAGNSASASALAVGYSNSALTMATSAMAMEYSTSASASAKAAGYSASVSAMAAG